MTAYQGVRIADFTQGVAGPMAAMLLGDFAAEVVKIEPPGGDRLAAHPGYLAWNRNKAVVTLDLATPAGLAAAKTLIAGADVALFDAAPGRLEAMGLDGPALTRAHPGLVHAWMPPYGVDGSWSQLPPHHSLLSGLTSIAFRQGAYADQPVHLTLPLAWYGQAVMGAATIGAALFERRRSGLGQAVTVTGLDGAAEVGAIQRVVEGEALPRGTPPGANPRYRLYQCADGEWFFLGTLFTPFYRKAFATLGLEDAFEALEADMLAARDLLEGVFLTRTRDEWLAELMANGVPCAPVRDREAWFEGEVVGGAGLRLSFQHPSVGEVRMPGPPATLSATPARVGGLPRGVEAAPAWPPRPTGAVSGSTVEPPLAGVRVLNLGAVIAGAYAGSLLASLGADVVKIESPEGDPFRSDGAQFIGFNHGARGLGLDLKQPAARDLFLEMARQADVVIDNYRLGVRARLGIDYAALRAVNPRIISCSINAYGTEGPRAALPGFDPLLQAEAGMMAGQGGAETPTLHTIAVNDVATAGVVTAAVIAALNAREITGQGQEILSSLLAQSLLFQIGEVTTYPGRPPNPAGTLDCLGLSAAHRYYPCADGWIGLVCVTEADVQALGAALGLSLSAEALHAPADGDVAEALAEVIGASPRAAILERLAAAGVAAAPAFRPEEAIAEPWLWANGFLAEWRHPRLGPVLSAPKFATFARTPGGFRHPTPELGGDTRAVLADFGVGDDRIEALYASGAVFGPIVPA